MHPQTFKDRIVQHSAFRLTEALAHLSPREKEGIVLLRLGMFSLTPEQRLTLRDAVFDPACYCPHCGNLHPRRNGVVEQVCQCWNEE